MEEKLYGTGGVECPVLVSGPREAPGILLLHGYSFTRRVWVETGTLQALSAEGFRVVAPDMPYGRETACSKRTRSIDLNILMVEAAVKAFVGKPYVLLGASLGGKIASYYSVTREMPGGLILVAPAIRSGDRIADKLRLLRRIPVLVMWGTRDRIVSKKVIEWIVEETGGRLIVFEGAGHPLYLDYPDRFNLLVAEFARSTIGRS